MRPREGALGDAYDVIETYLALDPGKSKLREDRLTAPRGTYVWVSIISFTNPIENSYFLEGSTSQNEGWLAAERILYKYFSRLFPRMSDEEMDESDEEMDEITAIEDAEDRVTFLVDQIRDRVLTNEQELVVDVYSTLVRQ